MVTSFQNSVIVWQFFYGSDVKALSLCDMIDNGLGQCSVEVAQQRRSACSVNGLGQGNVQVARPTCSAFTVTTGTELIALCLSKKKYI